MHTQSDPQHLTTPVDKPKSLVHYICRYKVGKDTMKLGKQRTFKTRTSEIVLYHQYGFNIKTIPEDCHTLTCLMHKDCSLSFFFVVYLTLAYPYTHIPTHIPTPTPPFLPDSHLEPQSPKHLISTSKHGNQVLSLIVKILLCFRGSKIPHYN